MKKHFKIKTMRNIFTKQLLSNCSANLSSDFHNETRNFEGWGSTVVNYEKKCNSYLCHKARLTQRVVVWTIQPFVKTNPCILIKESQRNMEQKIHNPYSSNHLQEDMLDFAKNIIKNPSNLFVNKSINQLYSWNI